MSDEPCRSDVAWRDGVRWHLVRSFRLPRRTVEPVHRVLEGRRAAVRFAVGVHGGPRLQTGRADRGRPLVEPVVEADRAGGLHHVDVEELAGPLRTEAEDHALPGAAEVDG